MAKRAQDILILPGWQVPASRFEGLGSLLEQSGHTVHIVKFPGFPEGEMLKTPWHLDEYVSYVKKYLQKHKLKKPIIIAHSFGGRVALKLLAQNPTLARSLIMSGTPGYRALSGRARFGRWLSHRFGRTRDVTKPSAHGKIKKIFYRMIGAHDLSHLTGEVRQTFINVVEESLEGYMRALNIPTLLVWGEDDVLVSVAVARKMQQTMVNSQLVVVPQMRHNFIYKNPEIFISHVQSFIAT